MGWDGMITVNCGRTVVLITIVVPETRYKECDALFRTKRVKLCPR
jgi:hypothetical protein